MQGARCLVTDLESFPARGTQIGPPNRIKTTPATAAYKINERVCPCSSGSPSNRRTPVLSAALAGALSAAGTKRMLAAGGSRQLPRRTDQPWPSTRNRRDATRCVLPQGFLENPRHFSIPANEQLRDRALHLSVLTARQPPVSWTDKHARHPGWGDGCLKEVEGRSTWNASPIAAFSLSPVAIADTRNTQVGSGGSIAFRAGSGVARHGRAGQG